MADSSNLPPALAVIRITRDPTGWRDCARAYQVIVDGDELGGIRRGEAKEFSIEPGLHTLQLSIDWCTSRQGEFTLKAGESSDFHCRSGSMLTALWDVTFGRRNYIALEGPR